jgi:hypothetical protein
MPDASRPCSSSATPASTPRARLRLPERSRPRPRRGRRGAAPALRAGQPPVPAGDCNADVRGGEPVPRCRQKGVVPVGLAVLGPAQAAEEARRPGWRARHAAPFKLCRHGAQERRRQAGEASPPGGPTTAPRAGVPPWLHGGAHALPLMPSTASDGGGWPATAPRSRASRLSSSTRAGSSAAS